MQVGLIDRSESAGGRFGFAACRCDIELEDAGDEQEDHREDAEECLQITGLDCGGHWRCPEVLLLIIPMPGSVSGVVPAWEAEPIFLFVGNEKGMKRIAGTARQAAYQSNGRQSNGADHDSQPGDWPLRQNQDQ
jgi:hypothetical protein